MTELLIIDDETNRDGGQAVVGNVGARPPTGAPGVAT
jgi:hypothetical protein